MEGWLVFAVSICYLGVLFAIAWQGEREGRDGRVRPARNPLLYSLTLAVYCTSWTFFGSVGQAAAHGLDFLPIYIGPILTFVLAWPMIAKMVRIAKSQNAVSIADFLAIRYGKSQMVAALVTLVAVIGLVPYLALQLKAISLSYAVLTEGFGEQASLHAGDETALVAAMLMALFSILFGIRSGRASEHHRGLMRAIAFESMVKLMAFLTVGAAISFVLFGDSGPFTARVLRSQAFTHILDSQLSPVSWWSMTLIAGLAVLCLPRQFHVAVVENTDEADVRKAAWMFPLYLVLINLFVLPIALAGLVVFNGDISRGDSFMVSLPLKAGAVEMALLSFLGGLSAATSMAIVDTVALATMVCNDIVIPLLLRLSHGRGPAADSRVGLLLAIRQTAVVMVLGCAYLYYRLVGESYTLTSIGLISFAAVAQFGPTLIGGLFWRGGNRAGALAGIGIGGATWLYTMVWPSVVHAGWLPDTGGLSGPFGISWLSPEGFLGLGRLDQLARVTLSSLGLNSLFYVAVSLWSVPKAIDSRQAALFVDTEALSYGTGRPEDSSITLGDLLDLAATYLGEPAARQAFRVYTLERWGEEEQIYLPERADFDAIGFTERLLAGTIGGASARVVMAGSLKRRSMSRNAAVAMLDQASEAIRFNHALLTATLDNVRQGICVYDKELRLAVWNRRFLELNDLPDDLVKVGTPMAELIRFNVARGEYGNTLDIPSTTGRRRLSGDLESDVYERRRPDGTILEVATNPMPNGGFVATFTDVTDRHRAEEALKEANEGLERKVAERTTALAAAKAEAENANVAKTRFLTAVSHDLLQPLHAARLFAAALADRTRDSLVGKVDASLRSVESLLATLLDVSRLDGGAINPRPVDFDLAPLFKALAEEFSAIAAEQGLRFRAVISHRIVHSDPMLLRRILQNLLANAIRYTPEGRVLLGCRLKGDLVRIEIHDTGIGIPVGKQDEIFEEFRQLETPGGKGEKGLGLGLSIVDRIARLLDHKIRLVSTPGRGSCFSVEVPLVGSSRKALKAAPRERRAALSGEMIWCIDNDKTVQDGMRALLEGWNCRVETADGDAALLSRLYGGAADPAGPRALIVDYHLDGGRTGIEAARTVLARLGHEVPVIVVTADRSPSVKEDVESLGFALTYKPVRPAALRALLTRVLSLAA